MIRNTFAARVRDDLPNLVSLLVFLSVTALLFRSVEFALVVVASLGFHELGHAAAIAWHNLPWRIHFGLVGAWTWSPSEEREKLSQFENSVIHMAGPFFSLLLALIAVGLYSLWQPESQHLLILANFSAQLGFLNLLPLGPMTDGGKAVARIMASVPKERKGWAASLPAVVTAVMILVLLLSGRPAISINESTPSLIGLLLVGVWMASSLLIEASRARVKLDAASHPMTSRQVVFLLLVIWDILIVDVIVMGISPFWLAPEYVLGSLQNIIAIINLFRQVG